MFKSNTMINKKIYQNVFHLIAFFFLLFFATFSNAESEYKISVYGLSYHTGLKTEERNRLNEFNFGVSAGRNFNDKSFIYTVDVGVFNNSYSDTAAWVGGTILYKTATPFRIGLNARHWWTANNTYGEKVLRMYGLISLNMTDSVSGNVLLRRSGPIFYLGFDF
jgi:hypothetical protein